MSIVIEREHALDLNVKAMNTGCFENLNYHYEEKI